MSELSDYCNDILKNGMDNPESVTVIDTQFGLAVQVLPGEQREFLNYINPCDSENEILKEYGSIVFTPDKNPLTFLELWAKDLIVDDSEVKEFRIFKIDGDQFVRYSIEKKNFVGISSTTLYVPDHVIFTALEVNTLLDIGILHIDIERVKNA